MNILKDAKKYVLTSLEGADGSEFLEVWRISGSPPRHNHSRISGFLTTIAENTGTPRRIKARVKGESDGIVLLSRR
jgi:hypothetical protein